MSNGKFERIEKKFWMNADQAEKIEPAFMEHMQIDQYGIAPISNIYFDTDDYYLTRRSIEGPEFKEKLRVRSYKGFRKGSDVFVEIKRKIETVGYKRRIQVPDWQAGKLLTGEPIFSDNPQIEGEILQFVNRYNPKPKVFLSYERIAMYGKEDPSLRITIDKNIRYKMYEEGMDFGIDGNPVIEDESMKLMEIKANGSIPEWLIRELSDK